MHMHAAPRTRPKGRGGLENTSRGVTYTVKGGEMSGLGGGKLEQPRQWPGAQWTGRPLAWER